MPDVRALGNQFLALGNRDVNVGGVEVPASRFLVEVSTLPVVVDDRGLRRGAGHENLRGSEGGGSALMTKDYGRGRGLSTPDRVKDQPRATRAAK